MKMYMLAAVVALSATAAFAGSTTSPKDSKSNGSGVGQASSSYTGNGATIGGNGNGLGGADETTGPGTRSDNVHSFQGGSGPGNSDGPAGNSHH